MKLKSRSELLFSPRRKGFVVHGKDTLQLKTEVPTSVREGMFIRFRQEIFLDIGLGDYTFNVGFGTISQEDYAHRSLYPHVELGAKLIRVCNLVNVGYLPLVFDKIINPYRFYFIV